MIIRGGENIYPLEVEELLYTHPKVPDVQVIGVPDKKYGEEVMAWIRLKDDTTATAEEIRGFCEVKLSHFNIPRYIEFCSKFPMTASGKIQRFKLREDTGRIQNLQSEHVIKSDSELAT